MKVVKTISEPHAVSPIHLQRTLSRPRVKQYIADCLARAGVSDDTIARKVKQLLNAKSYSRVRVSRGKVDLVPVDDNATQARVLELAMKSLDWFSDGTSVNVFEGEEVGDLFRQASDLIGRYRSAVDLSSKPRGEGGSDDADAERSRPTERSTRKDHQIKNKKIAPKRKKRG